MAKLAYAVASSTTLERDVGSSPTSATIDFVIVQHKHHAPTPGLKSRRSAQAYGARMGRTLLIEGLDNRVLMYYQLLKRLRWCVDVPRGKRCELT